MKTNNDGAAYPRRGQTYRRPGVWNRWESGRLQSCGCTITSIVKRVRVCLLPPASCLAGPLGCRLRRGGVEDKVDVGGQCYKHTGGSVSDRVQASRARTAEYSALMTKRLGVALLF